MGAHKNDPRTTVVASGGDGTISSIVSHILGGQCKLGIIPAGTLNHFAKELDIPLDINKAIQTLQHGDVRKVDVGTVNGRAFINNASIGFYPRSLRFRDEHQGRIGKWPAAIIGLARTMLRPRKYAATIVVHGETKHFRTPFVFVGNNEYQRNGPDLGARKTVTNGTLALYVVKATRPLAILNSLLHTFLTKKRHTRDFAIYTASSFTVHTKRHTIRVARDGESSLMHSPLHFQSNHLALQVIAPHEEAARA